MKKVVYVTFQVIPYRTAFFNKLSEKCDLTVIYEKTVLGARNNEWCFSEELKHKYVFLTKKMKHNLFSVFTLLKYCWSGNDMVIFGCFNSKIQLIVMQLMRVFRRSYYLNLDGDTFAEGNSLKSKIKRFLLKGACGYFVAGEVAAKNIRRFVQKKVYSYGFSSLSEKECKENHEYGQKLEKDGVILVVGQYFDYKGMDVALKTAQMDSAHRYKFVGMGSRTELFIKEHSIPENVTVIPFLQKSDLAKEYQDASLLLLPSRQECWGLVINEAASFGTPIVSTWGSGAAVEYLSKDYPQLLAKPGDVLSLMQAMKNYWHMSIEERREYQLFLIHKSQSYSIESSVEGHLLALDEIG